MPNWRRVFIPGGTYAFTLVTDNRAPLFAEAPARAILRQVIRGCRQEWPFEILALVLLPDHLHTLWRLPDGDCQYPRRIGWIKKEFTKAWLKAGGGEQVLSASRERHRRRGVWQRKFWEHCIRGEDDLVGHLDYIHFNPVKHGYVGCARHWPFSTFHRDRRAGVYSDDWGCVQPRFPDFGHDFGEPGSNEG